MEEESKKEMRQDQIQKILFSRELGWQEIIYDLINTEQLDPWDIDITILTNKYLEKISNLEETDFFVSSKVLLAASLLLKIKSEILLNRYLKSIDDILFGKKEPIIRKPFERIDLEEEVPELIPRSPIPRYKKVTLKELIESLNKAIITENRRIKKVILDNNAIRETAISLPKRTISIKDKIKNIFNKIGSLLGEENKKVSFTELAGEEKDKKVTSFYPLLQLENQKKIWMEQEGHFEEIYIWLKKTYFKHNPDPIEEIQKELEEQARNMDKKQRRRIKQTEKEFSNPLGEN